MTAGTSLIVLRSTPCERFQIPLLPFTFYCLRPESGAFWAYQKLPLSTSLRRPLAVAPENESLDYYEDDLTPASSKQSYGPEEMDGRESGEPDERTLSNYFPDDKFYNYNPRAQEPVAFQRLNDRRPLPTNPVRQAMMEDIRTPIKHVKPNTSTSFRPSWLRNTQDVSSQRRVERERTWEDSPPSDDQDNMHTFQHAYRAQSTAPALTSVDAERLATLSLT